MEPKVSLLLIVCQGIGLFLTNAASSDPMVQIENTKIFGKELTFENKAYHQYLGIPYAQPPLDDLRFQKTVPLSTFPDQYDAHNPAPACLQHTDAPDPWYFNDAERSEDCLYVNIWTPADASPQNPKPVLFWIHSGQFKISSNYPDFYSGEPFAAIGDIILVTCTYRLGVFGFLSSNTDEAPGNAGLWDIKEALYWVNKYISSFGGDPSRVTIGGQSSGATIVGYLTLNDDAQGLYDKIIMQSGSPVNFQTDFRKKNEVLGKKLAKMVGCSKDDQVEFDASVIQCLKNVSAEDLEKAETTMVGNFPASWHPIMGDGFLPDNPRKSILNGNFRCKPLLIGNDRDEGSVILPILDTGTFGYYGDKAVEVTSAIVTKLLNKILKIFPDLSILPTVPDLPDLPAPVTPAMTVDPLVPKLPDPKPAVTVAAPVDKLPNGIPNVGFELLNTILGGGASNPNCTRHELYSALGDVTITCPTVYFAEKCAEKGNDVYFYYFIHQYSASPYSPWMGVTHFSEVQFVFGKPLRKSAGYTEEEKELSRQMIGYWSNFVKTGKPDPSWPKYTKDNPIYQVIGGSNETEPYGKGPHKTNCDLLREAYKVM